MNSKPLFDTKSIPAPENILATTAPHYSDIIAGPVFLLFAQIWTSFSHKNGSQKYPIFSQQPQ